MSAGVTWSHMNMLLVDRLEKSDLLVPARDPALDFF
jgi:hypothetical protein